MRIHPEGYRLLAVGIILTIVISLLSIYTDSVVIAGLALLCGLLALFTAYFFRDPERQAPEEQGIVLSPADGLVTRIDNTAATDAEGNQVVSIFLSPFDVHINRAPIAGRVSQIEYRRGAFGSRQMMRRVSATNKIF